MAQMRHYSHVDDMLRDSTSAELSGWYEYMRREDERLIHLIAHAILLAFNGEKEADPTKPTSIPSRQEEVIDTTDPDFAKYFQGFTDGKQQPAYNPGLQLGDYQIIDG